MPSQIPKIDVLTSTEIITTLLEVARSLSREHGFEKDLASSVIYSSFDEFIIVSLTLAVEFCVGKISYKSTSGKVYLSHKEPKGRIGSKIERLKLYVFPNSKDIFKLLDKIKIDRDDLFHNLILAHEKGIDIDRITKRIQTNSESLIKLWHLTMKSFDDFYSEAEKIYPPIPKSSKP